MNEKNKKEDGGAAFPAILAVSEDGQLRHSNIPGMSLRDWFAGMALAGMIAKYGVSDDLNGLMTQSTPNCQATDSYALADAMIVRRKK